MSWEEVYLKDITNFRKGVISSKKLNEFNYVSTDSMLPDKQGIINAVTLPNNGNVHAFFTNDILISNIRPYFKKIWMADRDGGCSNDVLVFPTNNKKIEPKFLYYHLSNDYFFDYMVAGSNGTKMPRGSKDSILKYNFKIPKISIQQKITNFISSYDKLIGNNTKRIKILEEMAEELYKEWFVRLRFPNYENTKIVDGIPDGWKKLKFDDIFQIKNGYAFKSSEYLDTGIQVLRTKDYSNSKWIRIDESIFISEDSSKKYRNFFVKKYDFLVIMVGASIGKYGIALDKDTNLLLNQNQWAVRTKKEFNEYCLFKLMIMKNMLNVLLSQKTGAARDFFRKSFLNKLEIILPPESIIVKFNVLFTPLFEELNVLILKNQNLKETRDLLLPRLLSGKLNIEDLEIV